VKSESANVTEMRVRADRSGVQALSNANGVVPNAAPNAPTSYEIRPNYYINADLKPIFACRKTDLRITGSSREDAQVEFSIYLLKHQRMHYFAFNCIHHYLFREASLAAKYGSPSSTAYRAVFCARHVVEAQHYSYNGLSNGSLGSVLSAVRSHIADQPRIALLTSLAATSSTEQALIEHMVALFWKDLTKSVAFVICATSNAHTRWIVVSMHHQTAKTRPIIVRIHDSLSDDDFFANLPVQLAIVKSYFECGQMLRRIAINKRPLAAKHRRKRKPK
jgi:hypothetical protein